MDATVPDLSDEPLSKRGEYPGLYFNEDRKEKRKERKKELAGELRTVDVVALLDSDTDGLACEVVLKEVHDDSVVAMQIGGEYGFRLFQAVQFVNRYTRDDTELVIADLAPDAAYSGFIGALAQFDGPVSVYDHHDWPQHALQSARPLTTELMVHPDEQKCAAQILQEARYPDAPAWLVEFLSVTADHDLYLKEDPRSDHLSTLSFVLDRARYVDAAREYGADMLENEELRTTYEEAEEDAVERMELAVERAEWDTIGDTTVAVTYFACHQSRTGDQLLENGADVAVIIKPTLNVSFRTTEEQGNAATLARQLGGNGHPTAAGASLYSHLSEGFETTWEQGGANAIAYMWSFLEAELA